jgi:hypothetical protein
MNWETIIRHYNSHHRSNKQKEFQWFRRRPSLEAAINVAAKAEAEPKAGKERGLRTRGREWSVRELRSSG